MPFTPQQMKEYRLKLRSQGRCVRCHKDNDTSGAICSTCRKRLVDITKHRGENLLCKDCGCERDDPTVVLCVNCSEKQTRYSSWRK